MRVMNCGMAALGLAAMLGMSFAASADVIIYDNGLGPENTSAMNPSNDSSGQYLADSFVLQDGASTISDIHWWGGYGGNNVVDDDFTIYIFDTLGDPPLHTIDGSATTRESTVYQWNNTLDIYAYNLDITPIALSANTTYWISIVGEDGWVWSVGSGNGYWESEDNFATWTDFAGVVDLNLAFYLTGPGEVVPEPATMVLLGMGIGALALRRKMNKA